MEERILKIKNDFNNIITVRNNVKNVFDILQVRIDRLRQIYSEFIQTNKNEMFVFGLDSFHFQSKLIDIEYEDMKRLFLAINNRMYCEYFKLHKIIVDYISKNITDKKSADLIKINNYPVYKDLEPYKEYKFEIILDVHENILNLLSILISIVNNKENELMIHKTKQSIGLNIDNFITSFSFNINIMREKILMYTTYIEFFHKMHSKYLKRFSNKIQLMYTHITNDIKFDDSIEISKNKKKELIDEITSNNIDKDLLKELRTSIGSETNSETSLDISNNSIVNTPNESPINRKKNIKNDIMPFFDNLISTNMNSSLLGNKKEKKDMREIFKKNVHKVTNMLQLCKQKNNEITGNKFNDNEIRDIFNGIDQSCDSIINNVTSNKSSSGSNIEFKIDEVILNNDEIDNTDCSIDFEEIDNEENSTIIIHDNLFVNKNQEESCKEDIIKEEDSIVIIEPYTRDYGIQKKSKNKYNRKKKK